jgi:hypothetical protein
VNESGYFDKSAVQRNPPSGRKGPLGGFRKERIRENKNEENQRLLFGKEKL